MRCFPRLHALPRLLAIGAAAVVAGLTLLQPAGTAQAAEPVDFKVTINAPATITVPGGTINFTIDVSRKTDANTDAVLKLVLDRRFIKGRFCNADFDFSGQQPIDGPTLGCRVLQDRYDSQRHQSIQVTLIAPSAPGQYGIYTDLSIDNAQDANGLDNFDAKQFKVLHAPLNAPSTGQRVCQILGC